MRALYILVVLAAVVLVAESFSFSKYQQKRKPKRQGTGSPMGSFFNKYKKPKPQKAQESSRERDDESGSRREPSKDRFGNRGGSGRGGNTEMPGWDKNTEMSGWGKKTEMPGWDKNTEMSGWGKKTEMSGWGKKTEMSGWGKNKEMSGWGKDKEMSGWGKDKEMSGWGHQKGDMDFSKVSLQDLAKQVHMMKMGMKIKAQARFKMAECFVEQMVQWICKVKSAKEYMRHHWMKKMHEKRRDQEVTDAEDENDEAETPTDPDQNEAHSRPARSPSSFWNKRPNSDQDGRKEGFGGQRVSTGEKAQDDTARATSSERRTSYYPGKKMGHQKSAMDAICKALKGAGRSSMKGDFMKGMMGEMEEGQWDEYMEKMEKMKDWFRRGNQGGDQDDEDNEEPLKKMAEELLGGLDDEDVGDDKDNGEQNGKTDGDFGDLTEGAMF